MEKKAILILVVMTAILISSAEAQVSVMLPDTSATIGETIELPVLVSQLADSIFSYQFTLTMDTSKIVYKGYQVENTLTQPPWQAFVNANNRESILIGAFGIQPLQNDRILIILKFEIKGSHLDSAILHFTNFLFNSGEPQAVTKDGVVKIYAPLVSVSFTTNVNDTVSAYIDGEKKILPFDTTWYATTEHQISAINPQIFDGNRKYLFRSWSDGGDTSHTIIVQSDTSFLCLFDTYYYVQVNSNFGDFSGAGWYEAGTQATISVNSQVNFGDTTRAIFTFWQGTYSSNSAIFSFSVTQPVIESAIWRFQHYLTVVSPYGNPEGEGWYNAGDTAYFSVDSTEFVEQNERYAFLKWQGRGRGSFSGNNREYFVIMENPIVETAIWKHEYFLVFKSQPENLIELGFSGWYEVDSSYSVEVLDTITVDGKVKYRFSHWRIGEDSLAVNPLLFNVGSAFEATAVYQIDSVLAVITANFSEIWLSVDGTEVELPYQKFWKYQSIHRISADSLVYLPDSLKRYRFLTWRNSNELSYEIKADSAIEEEAEFKKQFYLEILTDPPGLHNFSETGWYDENDSVTIEKAPRLLTGDSDTLRFENWVIDGESVVGNPISIIMDTSHVAIAMYNYWLTLSGRVTDSRGGGVPDANVILTGAKNDSVKTDSSGYFFFYQLNPDEYRVSAHVDWGIVSPENYGIKLIDSSVDTLTFVAVDTVKPMTQILFAQNKEKFYAGDMDTLFWRASDNRSLDSVICSLSLDAGKNWLALFIKTENFNDSLNFYFWIVPDTVSDSCLIKIEAIDYEGNYSCAYSPIFRISRPSFVKDNNKNWRPKKLVLKQNFPNPFNNSTLICFDLPRREHVVLAIYNCSGQKVRQLMDENLQEGTHSVRWDGRDFAGREVGTGVYFYQLKTDQGISMTRKLLYLK